MIQEQSEQIFDYPDVVLKPSNEKPVQYSQRRVIKKQRDLQNELVSFYDKETFDYRTMFIVIEGRWENNRLQQLFNGKFINYQNENVPVHQNRNNGRSRRDMRNNTGADGKDRRGRRRGEELGRIVQQNNMDEKEFAQQSENSWMNEKDDNRNIQNIGKGQNILQQLKQQNSWMKPGDDNKLNYNRNHQNTNLNKFKEMEGNQGFGDQQSEINPLKNYQKLVLNQSGTDPVNKKVSKINMRQSKRGTKNKQKYKEISKSEDFLEQQAQQDEDQQQEYDQQQKQESSKIDDFSLQYRNAQPHIPNMIKANKKQQIIDGDNLKVEQRQDMLQIPNTIYISQSKNLEDILKDILQQEEQMQQRNEQDRIKQEQRSNKLKQLQNLSIKSLIYNIKTQNCSKISIKAILDPLGIPIKASILQDTSYLRMDSRKITIPRYSVDSLQWNVGKSKVKIQPLILKMKCYSCGKMNHGKVLDYFCSTICDNSQCTKNLHVQISSITLQE